MFDAAGPFWPCVTSNETFWPSFSDLNPLIWIELWWAKRSLPPSSGVMNPKPLESLNHLTVPVAMCAIPFFNYETNPSPVGGHDIQERELTATTGTTCGGEEGRTSSLLESCGAH